MALRTLIASGLKQLSGGLRLPTGAIAPNTGWFTWGTLPGTSIDFRRQAGDLWRNSVVSICLAWKDDTFGEARLIAQRQDSAGKWVEVPNHPLVQLLDNPNPWYDGSTLFAGINLSMDVDGNAYLIKLQADSGKLVGLHYAPHFQMEPVPGGEDGWLSHYWWTVGTRRYRLEPEQVVHLRDRQDPRNQLKGLSRLGAMLRHVVTENEFETYSAGLLHSAGLMRLLISPKQFPEGRQVQFGKEQAGALKRLWRESAQEDNFIDPIVPTLPIEVSTPGMTPKEMIADKLARIPTDFICAAMSVDPMTVGLPSDNKTYSNITEANRGTYENVKQAHRRIDRQLTKLLMPEVLHTQEGDRLSRDYSEVAALQEDVDLLHARARDDYQRGIIKRMTALRMIGEEYDETTDDLFYTDLVAAEPVRPQDESGTGVGKSLKAARMAGVRRLIASEWRKQIPAAEDE